MEIKEAVAILQGKGPDDLQEVCLILASHMLVLGGKAASEEEAREILRNKIDSGEALDKLKKMVLAQGGDVSQIDDTSLLPEAELQVEVKSDRDGFIESIQAEEIGIAAMLLGAGRETKDSIIDLAAGVDLRKKIGDPVHIGEVLAVLHLNRKHEKGLEEAKSKVLGAYGISEDKVPVRPLVFALVTPEGIKRF
ncbi:Pyrimidine-nucleoside phosphorylase [compost metagenome]